MLFEDISVHKTSTSLDLNRVVIYNKWERNTYQRYKYKYKSSEKTVCSLLY